MTGERPEFEELQELSRTRAGLDQTWSPSGPRRLHEAPAGDQLLRLPTPAAPGTPSSAGGQPTPIVTVTPAVSPCTWGHVRDVGLKSARGRIGKPTAPQEPSSGPGTMCGPFVVISLSDSCDASRQEVSVAEGDQGPVQGRTMRVSRSLANGTGALVTRQLSTANPAAVAGPAWRPVTRATPDHAPGPGAQDVEGIGDQARAGCLRRPHEAEDAAHHLRPFSGRGPSRGRTPRRSGGMDPQQLGDLRR